MVQRFQDRTDAGRQLAGLVTHRRSVHPIVLALPRGGLPVAFEVAQALDAPRDILDVRKLGVPSHEELAMGAIATGGVRVLNEDVIASEGITASMVEEARTRSAGGTRTFLNSRTMTFGRSSSARRARLPRRAGPWRP